MIALFTYKDSQFFYLDLVFINPIQALDPKNVSENQEPDH
jgi:hypothetical protein